MREKPEWFTSRPVKKARSKGHLMASFCAGKAGIKWEIDAYVSLKQFAVQNATFTVEDVRKAFPELKAHDDRAWGHIVRWAQIDELIAPCGQTPVESSRGSFKTLWQSLIRRK